MLKLTAKADKILIIMNWRPQSLDLNIIEAVRDFLDREKSQTTN